jgi:O-antigen/teichoic acid export membrane protein
MFKQIFGTLSSRGFSAMILFVIIMLTSHYFGTEGRAEIAVFNANMNIGILLSSLFGNSIIYLSTKYDTDRIAIYALIWASCIAAVFSLVLMNFFSVTTALLIGVSVLAGGIFESNLNILSAKNKMNRANVLKFVQVLLNLCFTLFIIYSKLQVWHYLLGFVLSYIIVLCISFGGVINNWKNKFSWDTKLLKTTFELSFWTLVANVFALLTTRFIIFYLNENYEKNLVGIIGNTFNLIDAVWIIGNSLAFVLFVNLTQNTNIKTQYLHTVLFIKISVIVTTILLLTIACLPNIFFVLMFGLKFMSLKSNFLQFSLSILLSIVIMKFSAYFASKGNIKINAFGALIGFISTVIFSKLLMKNNPNNAALVLTISYSLMLFWAIWHFFKENKLVWKDWLINKSDIHFIQQKWKTNVWNRRNN